MKKLICIIACISLVIWGGVRLYQDNITFNQNCKGHLKLAADANTVELAKQELAIAVKYCEDQGLTQGYTSIMYRTPDEDVKFWYTNLKASLNELNAVSADATQLEKSNVLMKLRETLLDNRNDGTSVTYPEGISIYPNNMAYCIWALISFIVAVIAGIGWFREDY